jgi:hypothetical protein
VSSQAIGSPLPDRARSGSARSGSRRRPPSRQSPRSNPSARPFARALSHTYRAREAHGPAFATRIPSTIRNLPVVSASCSVNIPSVQSSCADSSARDGRQASVLVAPAPVLPWVRLAGSAASRARSAPGQRCANRRRQAPPIALAIGANRRGRRLIRSRATVPFRDEPPRHTRNSTARCR